MVIELSNIQQTTKVRPRSATLITDTGGIVNRGKQAALGATAEAARGVAANARIQEQSALEQAQAFARIGQAVQNAGNAAFDIALKKRKVDEDREIKQGLIKFANLRQTKMAELFSLKGEAASQRSREIADELEAAKEEIASGGSTERVRLESGAALSMRLIDSKGTIARYDIQQRDESNKLTAAARQVTAMNDAAESPGNMNILENSARVARESAITKTQGYDPTGPIVQAQIEENQSKVMESAITSAIKNKNYLLARALLDKKGQYENVPDVVGTARASLRKALQEVELIDRVDTTVGNILITPLDETEALAEANLKKNGAFVIIDGNLRKQVKTEIRLRFSDKDRATTRKRQEEKLRLISFAQDTVNKLRSEGYTHPQILAKIKKMKVTGHEKDAATKEANAQFREDDIIKTRARQNKAIDTAGAVNDAVSKILGESKSEIAARVKARKRFNDDPIALKMAERRIKEFFAAKQRDDRRKRIEASGKAAQFIAGGGTLDQFKAKNPSLFDSISKDISTVVKLEEYERQVASGKFFAKKDNIPKFTLYRKMPDSEIVKVSEEELKVNLTEDSFNIIVKKQETAQRRINKPSEARIIDNTVRSIVRDLSKEEFTTRRGSRKTREVLSRAQQQVLTERLDSFVTDFVADKNNKGKSPDRGILEKEAQRLVLSLKSVSDPDNTGFLFTPKPGEQAFNEITLFIKDMSPQQRAAARVPMEAIPANIQQALEFEAKKGGVEVVYPLLIESLAAAYAAGDEKRMENLIKNAANPERQIGTEAN